MKFRYSCVNCPNVNELEYILEHERTITHDTFRRNIGKKQYDKLNRLLGYDKYNLTLKTDYHVSYHKSKTPDGKIVYYLDHSAIEYVYY